MSHAGRKPQANLAEERVEVGETHDSRLTTDSDIKGEALR
jgi:hypothetical protein